MVGICYKLSLMRGALLILAMVLATAAEAAPKRYVVVHNDLGGHFDNYANRLEKQEPMAITGRCESACTMYLANPNACVHRSAVLAFHAPISIDQVGDRTAERELTSLEEAAARYMMGHYPLKVQEWIISNGGFKVTTLLELKGEELQRLGPICPPEMDRVLFPPLVVQTAGKGDFSSAN